MAAVARPMRLYDREALALRFRRRRLGVFTPLIEAAFAERGRCRIIDLGGRAAYWSLFDRDFLWAHNVQVTTVNLEPPEPGAGAMFSQVQGDVLALDHLADGSFEIAHSNSVIEHVGDWDNVERFAAQVRRLAPRYFVQAPYQWFPMEPHFSAPFFHWLPESTRARALMKKAHGWAPRSADMGEAMRMVQSARLPDKAMMRHLFPDAVLKEERVLGLTKSLMAVRG